MKKDFVIGIVGMGSMGRGIAKECEARGMEVVALHGRDDLVALERCDLVIESVIEDLVVKREVIARIEAAVTSGCVIASNTSSLPVATLAEGLKNPSRFVGVHFFSPVKHMKLVEIAPTTTTYPRAVEDAIAFVEALDKTPVVVSDTSGYIVNRLLVPYLLDGIAALEKKLAPAKAIDTAMKLGCGHPMGPLELSDAIGLDVVYAMARTLHREHNDRRFSPPALLRRLVQLGHLGKKTARGLYDYRAETRSENAELWPEVRA